MSIFSRLFGDSNLVNLDDKVDQLLGSMPSKTGDNSNDDVTGKIVKSFLDNASSNEVDKLFENVGVPSQRLSRYSTYDEINKAVPIIRRILKVYIANVLPKNPVDGKCVIYRESTQESDESTEYAEKKKKAKLFAQEVMEDQYELIEKYKRFVLPRKLLYGDCFVEVVDLGKDIQKVDLNKSSVLLTEGQEEYSHPKTQTQVLKEIDDLTAEINRLPKSNGNFGTSLDFVLSKFADLITDSEDFAHTLERLQLEKEKEKDVDEKRIRKNLGAASVLIKVHKPHNILVLDTKYGSRVGYLEILSDKNDTSNLGLSKNFSAAISKITSAGKLNEVPEEKMVNKLIYHVIKKIVSKTKVVGTGSMNDVDALVKSLDEDVYAFIKRMFIEQGIYNKSMSITPMKVRFISPDRMVQFSNPSVDYTPYGESIVESLILPCKLYMLAQLANSITKLSRASLIRKWNIDVGSSQMHSQLIQKLKRELYNTKVTLEDLSNFKSIPKILSDFKD